ncbi:MAG: hypothetical protein IPH76_05015 [Xanthomonadales bacterium]|nr:hypothetical protein [Xanthomonadales bacterium]
MKPTFRCASGALAIALCASAQLASAANGLDPTFGDDGLTEFVLGDVRATNLVKSMVTADDGVVTMCGALGLELADRKAAILRVLANGSQDPGFGPQHGWVVLPGTVGCDDLALQSTGNVIALIHTDSGYHLNRILANGSIDPQFGVQGVTQLWPDIARPKAVGVLGNGDIVVAGLNVDWQDGNSDFRVRRYTANGAPVPGFGSGGNADLAFDQGSSMTMW